MSVRDRPWPLHSGTNDCRRALVTVPCGKSKIWDRDPIRGSVTATEAYPLDARRSRDLVPKPGSAGRRLLPLPATVRSRTVSVLLLGLALTLLVSGCGGASPETRARQTKTALHATLTPLPLQATRTAIAPGTFTDIDEERAGSLTAEASLPVTSGTFRGTEMPAPRNVATHMAENLKD